MKILPKFLLVAALLVAVGCQRNYPPMLTIAPGDAQTIEVRRNVQFADLPAPQEFKFNRRQSRNFQGSALRGGKVVYDGTWIVSETGAWYGEEMPKTGWTLIGQSAPSDYDITYTFRKADEIAAIRIWRPSRNTRVEIALDKSGRETF